MFSGDTTLASFLWLIICVVLVMGLAYWFTRYVAGRGALRGFQPGRQMEALDQLPLGRDQRVVLVRAGERFLLLGATPAGISLLAEHTKEEAASWKREAEERPGFQEALMTVLSKKKRR